MILENKVALVTGGATGIGRATATLAVSAEQRAFGAAGAKLIFSDKPNVEGKETAALIRDTGAECLFVKSDVSSEENFDEIVSINARGLFLYMKYEIQQVLI